ncbi:MAG: flagellar hook-length control protein FliK [Alphaproteobacteria bacterium]
MEIISSPLPAIPVDVGDASMQRDLALKLAAMALASQAARPEATKPTGTDTAARTLLSTLTTLARSQDSLGQLLADLSRPEALARVPAEVRADIARVLTLARPIVQAGLTRPAPATPQAGLSVTPPGPAPMATADPLAASLAPLADALQRLEASLKAWQPALAQQQTPAAPQPRNPATPAAPPTPAQSTSPSAAATPATLPAPGPDAPLTATPASAPRLAMAGPPLTAEPAGTPPAPSRPLGADPLRAGAPQASADPQPAAAAVPLAASLLPQAMPAATPTPQRPGGIADALVSLLLAQQAGASPEENIQRLRSQRQAQPATLPADSDAMLASNAVSAYRKAMPSAPVSGATQWPSDPSEALVARTLLQRTEAALTQTRLLDVSSQLQRAEQAPAHTANTTQGHWSFDLPLATPLGQSLVRFEIDRQARKSGRGKNETVWRARLSLDIEPLGPIHAHVALLGTEKTWVSLWAERPETAQLLAEGQSMLRQSLGTDALDAEIVFHGGAPPAQPDATGGMWNANA